MEPTEVGVAAEKVKDPTSAEPLVPKAKAKAKKTSDPAKASFKKSKRSRGPKPRGRSAKSKCPLAKVKRCHKAKHHELADTSTDSGSELTDEHDRSGEDLPDGVRHGEEGIDDGGSGNDDDDDTDSDFEWHDEGPDPDKPAKAHLPHRAVDMRPGWKLRYGEMPAGDLMWHLHEAGLQEVMRCTQAHFEACKRIPPTIHELLKMLGLRLAMTLVKLPREELYWGQEPERGACTLPSFDNIMTKNRFNTIGRGMRYSFQSDQDDDDKCWKVRRIYDIWRKSILGVHQGWTSNDNAADEAMFPCRIRRAPCIRCMPNKPISHGWKFYVLASCD